MMNNYVRICPVCDTENPLERAYCSHCASLLADVDFSLSPLSRVATEGEGAETVKAAEGAEAVEGAEGAEVAEVAEGAEGAEGAEVAEAAEITGVAEASATGAAVEEAATPAEIPVQAVRAEVVAEAAEVVAQEDIATASWLGIEASAPPAEALRCPDPDCGQFNPPGTLRCLYCNASLSAEIAVAAAAERIAAPLPSAPSSGFELAPPDLMTDIAPPAFVTAADLARQHARTLPPALATRFQVKSELVAASSDADLLIVEELAGGKTLVAKIYRHGIPPDNLLLERLKLTTPHVVRIVEHGSEDGVDWEVMEYCRAGNLRSLMPQGRPMQPDLLWALVKELAAGLNEIHAFNILHRDLKPENVLLRRRDPLSLALTDFGLASLSASERHFTDNACTLKYAAPEALTGVLDVKTDWWSLGMILLEAASGHHPFEGLSEQVIHHYLVTRSIEIKGVADARFAQLCRGLLLREPEHRYGAEEVARWLAGDPGLPPLLESGGKIVHPYRLGKHRAKNSEELARALAENWQAGIRDLERGLIRDWLQTDLRDFELIRSLDNIMEARGESIECRLLRFLRVAAPGLPPVWRGELADQNALMTHARRAIADGTPPADMLVWQDWLESLFASKALMLLDDAELAELDQRWRQCFALVEHVWEVARGKRRQLRSNLPRTQGNADGRVVNFDAAVYGSESDFRFPARRQWHAPILLALSMPDFLTMVRKDVLRAVGRYSDEAPWFAAVAQQGQKSSRTPDERIACLLVAWRLRDVAMQEAEAKRAHRQAEAAKRKHAVETWQQTFVGLLSRFLAADAETFDGDDIQEKWRLLLDELQTLSDQLTKVSYPGADFEHLLQGVSTVRRQSFALEAAFDLADARREQIAIIMQAPRLGLLCGGLLLIAWMIGAWAWLPTLGGVGFIALLYWRRHQADNGVIAQIRRLQRQSRALIAQMKKDAPAA
ncbi:MAG: serine/threonine protein kinase [Zoogloeaceae bacterium]|jgi:hypothetical protein|nr:serine/threonine protein kinase [Zoogloeaceae bacterium]